MEQIALTAMLALAWSGGCRWTVRRLLLCGEGGDGREVNGFDV